MTGRLEKPPQWISSLQGLSGIIFRYSLLRSDPLEYLQDLPNLGYLYLDCAYEGEELCFKAGGFPRLKRLVFTRLSELRRLIVKESSTPLLEELKLRESKSMAQFLDDIHHLVHLQRLQFADMSDMFINQLEHMDKESNEYEWILQVSMVVIRNSINGKWHTRSLDQATGNFI
ncbi:hypothetical protein LIER_13834 [Lithospermum erythrorhizon]|uniref:Disease resistance R13L4/SHOC-2-like LRR domain-containing protein n=1 Tax=Lithospermum erythrorhizon TaxID=34254 RepID=A0AAV3PXB3_LITER